MISRTLPDHLAERCSRLSDVEPASGDFVLYWMRTACRAHENPALDVALTAGRGIDKPVFVYHALSESYPYASDRHHTFIVEGARDVQAEMAARGVGYAFHLERPGHRGRHLVTLGEKAALVVAEDMPVDPLCGWTKRLAEATSTPVWAVDTACVVPMRLVVDAPMIGPSPFAVPRNIFGKSACRAYGRTLTRTAPPSSRMICRSSLWICKARRSRIWSRPARSITPSDRCRTPKAAQAPAMRAGRHFAISGCSAMRRIAMMRCAPTPSAGCLPICITVRHLALSPRSGSRRESAAKGLRNSWDELLVWRELSYAWCFHRSDHEQVSGPSRLGAEKPP